MAPYLWDRGIRTVDVVALSHAHEDHIGGLPALIADFHPRELWTGATPDSPAWRARARQSRRATARKHRAHAQRRASFAFGGAADRGAGARSPTTFPRDAAEEQRFAGAARALRPPQPFC